MQCILVFFTSISGIFRIDSINHMQRSFYGGGADIWVVSGYPGKYTLKPRGCSALEHPVHNEMSTRNRLKLGGTVNKKLS